MFEGGNLQRQKLPLHLQRAHFLTTRLDDIHAPPALDEVHRALGPLTTGTLTGALDGTSDSDISRLEPLPLAVIALHERLLRRFLIAPVLAEDRRTAELDLALALAAVGIDFLARTDDLVGVGVEESRLDRRQRPADGAVDAVGEVETAADGHADLGHAVALEQHVAVAKLFPGFFGRGGEGRGAGDVQAQVLRGDGLSGCLLRGWWQLREARH